MLIPSRIYRFREFELSLASRQLLRNGSPVSLGSKAFEVLVCLVAHAGQVVSKEQLLKTVWPESFVEDGNLAQHIFTLRKTFGEGADFIKTIPGRGYQFTEHVLEVDPPTATPTPSPDVILQHIKQRTHIVIEESIAPPPSPASLPPSQHRLSQHRLWVIALSLVAVAGLAAWALWSRLTRPVPGDHHEIVLADLDNATHDPDLTRPLKTALAIDLKQSPYLLIASDAKVSQTLHLMEQPSGAPLTTALAREVCQRIGDQAVLSGSIASFGKKYLVTLVASDCASGADLAESKSVASDRDGVLQALDSVAAQMRKRLGEPLKSLRQFQKPLLAKETNSLDALKLYTQAHDLGMEGKFQQAIPFFQRAIELDPNFAVAYADLGAVYGNIGESSLGAQAWKKAYDLRNLSDERDRLYIVAMYSDTVTGNLDEAIRNYETWTETYPNTSSPWANLANLENQIGRYDMAIQHAQRALSIEPDSPFAYIMLSRAQLASNRPDDAKATCRLAIGRKMDVAELRGVLFYIAFLQNDTTALQEQIAWARGTKSEPYITLQQARMNFAQGKPRAAHALFDQLTEGYRKQGLTERADRMMGAVPRMDLYMGDLEAARELLHRIAPPDGSTDVPVALAEVGDVAQAEALLEHQLQKRPDDTLWNFFRAPQIRAAIDLERNKPEEAIAALRVGAPYDLRSTELPFLRGQAYLAAHQPALAEAEFRRILEHPGIDPLSPENPLAHLGLARAYSAQGNFTASRSEYNTLFTLWKNAEPNLPTLRAAQSEFQHLAR